jgi:hypothetical protein
MKKLLVVLALTFPVFANTGLFTKYEAVRQGLLKSSLADVQKNAAALAKDARTAKNNAVAVQADAVAKSADLVQARTAFGALSDEMVKVQKSTAGTRPAVYYCSMVKKSWLQAKGKVGNPYDSNMAMCGELKAE